MSEEALYGAGIKFLWGQAVSLAHKVFKKKPVAIEELKRQTQVLFVDDESYENLMATIRQAGWNVRQISDISNFDSEDVKQANIIFMDFKNVGNVLSPQEEGIGLLKGLKSKYPNKYLIFISGYAGLIPGHEVFNIADSWIPKNSDPYVYIDTIENAARLIYGK